MKKTIKELISTLQKNGYTYENVDQASELVLQTLNQKSIPIQIVSIVEAFGFRVYQNDMEDDISGFIAVDSKWQNDFNTDKLIVVNSDHNYGHKRFTIAHELGHYLLDYTNPNKPYYDAYRQSKSYCNEEKRANQFAANLLMPRTDFIDAHNDIKNTGKNITSLLSEKFGVSAKAIEMRIQELDLE